MHLAPQPVEHHNCKQYTGFSAFLPHDCASMQLPSRHYFRALDLRALACGKNSEHKMFLFHNILSWEHSPRVSGKSESAAGNTNYPPFCGRYQGEGRITEKVQSRLGVWWFCYDLNTPTVLVIEYCILLILLLPQWSASSHTMRLIVYREAHDPPTVPFSLLLSLYQTLNSVLCKINSEIDGHLLQYCR